MSILPVISCSNTKETIDGYAMYYETAIKTHIFNKMKEHIEVDKQIFDKVDEKFNLKEQICEINKQQYNLFGLFLDKNIEDTNSYLKKFNSKWLPRPTLENEPQLSISNFRITYLQTNSDNTIKSFKFTVQLSIYSYDEKENIKESKELKFESNKFEIWVRKN